MLKADHLRGLADMANGVDKPSVCHNFIAINETEMIEYAMNGQYSINVDIDLTNEDVVKEEIRLLTERGFKCKIMWDMTPDIPYRVLIISW